MVVVFVYVVKFEERAEDSGAKRRRSLWGSVGGIGYRPGKFESYNRAASRNVLSEWSFVLIRFFRLLRTEVCPESHGRNEME